MKSISFLGEKNIYLKLSSFYIHTCGLNTKPLFLKSVKKLHYLFKAYFLQNIIFVRNKHCRVLVSALAYEPEILRSNPRGQKTDINTIGVVYKTIIENILFLDGFDGGRKAKTIQRANAS